MERAHPACRLAVKCFAEHFLDDRVISLRLVPMMQCICLTCMVPLRNVSAQWTFVELCTALVRIPVQPFLIMQCAA